MLKYCFQIEDADIVVTSSGVTGPDLQLSPKAKQYYPIVIEVKNQEKISIWAALEQTQSHKIDESIPVLAFKRNNSELYCCLEAKYLMMLLNYVKSV